MYYQNKQRKEQNFKHNMNVISTTTIHRLNPFRDASTQPKLVLDLWLPKGLVQVHARAVLLLGLITESFL